MQIKSPFTFHTKDAPGCTTAIWLCTNKYAWSSHTVPDHSCILVSPFQWCNQIDIDPSLMIAGGVLKTLVHCMQHKLIHKIIRVSHSS